MRNLRLMFALIAAGVAASVLSSAPLKADVKDAKNSPSSWVMFMTKESPSGSPQLIVKTDGVEKVVHSSADTMVISYLADRTWGELPHAVVTLNGKAQSLFGFPTAGVSQEFDSAVLRLNMKMSRNAPIAPFELAAHEVSVTWDELQTKWTNRPKHSKAAPANTTVKPLDGAIDIDVTQLLKNTIGRDGEQFAVLVRIASPLGGEADAVGSSRPRSDSEKKPLPPWQPLELTATQWEQRFEWASSHKEALSSAKQDGKIVMTIIYSQQMRDPEEQRLDPSALPYHVLMRGPMTDPDLTTLVQKNFVLRREAYHIHAFSKDVALNHPDPFTVLGTNRAETQPPAILFHSADGKLLRRINRLGTFNARMLHAALTRVVRENLAQTPEERLFHVPNDLSPSIHAVWLNAKRHFHAGDAESALSALDSALSNSEHTKHRAPLTFLQAKFLHHDGRKKEARTQFSVAIELGLSSDQHAEAKYWLLDCEPSSEERTTIQEWAAARAKDAPTSIWLAKILSRTPMTELHMTTAESFDLSDGHGLLDEPTAELADAVPRSLQYLVRTQSRFGDWRPLAGDYQMFSQPAITAICAGAIHRWRRPDRGIPLSPELLARLEKAEQAATTALYRYEKQVNQLKRLDYLQVWNQTYVLEYFLMLLEDGSEDEQVRKAAQSLINQLVRHQYEEGGWSYLPPTATRGWNGIRPHSFNTAPILIELVRAKKLGLEVDSDVISRAVKSLESVRAEDGAFAYAPATGFAWMTRHRSAIARDPLCELALHSAGAENRPAVVAAFERFHLHRADLEIPRKLYSSYFNTNGHGSYFFAFAYYYAAQAIGSLPEEQRSRAAKQLQDDLLSVAELDGTWIDNHAQGKAYATGMVLKTLDLTTQQR